MYFLKVSFYTKSDPLIIKTSGATRPLATASRDGSFATVTQRYAKLGVAPLRNPCATMDPHARVAVPMLQRSPARDNLFRCAEPMLRTSIEMIVLV